MAKTSRPDLTWLKIRSALRQARLNRGWSQGDLARATGYTAPRVSQCEQPVEEDLPSKYIEKILDALGFATLQDLLDGQRPRPAIGVALRATLEAPPKGLEPSLEKALAPIRTLRWLSEELGGSLPTLPRIQKAPPERIWDSVRQGQAVAEEFRRMAGISSLRPPHDLEALLTGLEVALVPLKLPKGVSGAAIGDKDHGNVIVFDRDEIPRRQRFTVAHELGHLVMDALPLIDAGQNPQTIETRANSFAASILMPSPWIHRVARGLGVSQLGDSKVPALDSTDGDLSISKARRVEKGRGPFGNFLAQVVVEAAVSFQAATYRLQSLGYLAEDEGQDLRESVGPPPKEPGLASNLAYLVWWKTLAALEGERITPRRAKEILAPVTLDLEIPMASLDELLGLPVVMP